MNRIMRIFIITIVFSMTCYAQQQVYFPDQPITLLDTIPQSINSAYDIAGKLHIVYTKTTGSTNETTELFYVKELELGFSEPFRITNNSIIESYSTISIDDSNFVHITFKLASNDPNPRIMYLNNKPGSFIEPVTVYNRQSNVYNLKHKIGENNEVHILFSDDQPSGGPDHTWYIMYNHVTLVTTTNLIMGWYNVSHKDFDFDVDSSNKVHVVTRDFGNGYYLLYKYFLDGQGGSRNLWGSDVRDPMIKVGRNNIVYITFADLADQKVYFIRKKDGQYSIPIVISPPDYNYSYRTYQLFIDDSSNAYVAFQKRPPGIDSLYIDFYQISDTTVSAAYRLFKYPNADTIYTDYFSFTMNAKKDAHLAFISTRYHAATPQAPYVLLLSQGFLYESLPIELISFDYYKKDGNYFLNWSTASETNNLGFEVQRKFSDDWLAIGFVNGAGTSTSKNSYSFFLDGSNAAGTFRLKQTDFNGNYSYSDPITVNSDIPDEFHIYQNYPNPFNPATKFTYSLPEESYIKIEIFDFTGQKVDELFKGNNLEGNHTIEWNAKNFVSGNYLAVFSASNLSGNLLFRKSLKLQLLK